VKIVIAVVVATLFVAGCQGRSVGPSPSEVQEVEITMSEFKFEPSTIEVKAGKVKFHFNNTGAIEHTAVIPELSKGTSMVKPGTDFDVELDLPAGTYNIVCDIPGHKEAGMEMTLVVK